jgi:hypothetical protein
VVHPLLPEFMACQVLCVKGTPRDVCGKGEKEKRNTKDKHREVERHWTPGS